MPRVAFTEDEVEATKRRLCAAALRVFERDGYAAATMRSIAREAGCSPAAPYVYFPAKADLLSALRGEGFEQLAAALEGAVAATLDPIEQLRRVMLTYIDFGLSRPDMYRLMFALRQGDLAGLPRVRAGREASLGVARRVCARLVEAGLLAGDFNTQAHLLWLECHGLLSLHLANQLDLGCDRKSLVRALADHWTAPLTAARRDGAKQNVKKRRTR